MTINLFIYLILLSMLEIIFSIMKLRKDQLYVNARLTLRCKFTWTIIMVKCALWLNMSIIQGIFFNLNTFIENSQIGFEY
jgi:hypothetical protein